MGLLHACINLRTSYPLSVVSFVVRSEPLVPAESGSFAGMAVTPAAHCAAAVPVLLPGMSTIHAPAPAGSELASCVLLLVLNLRPATTSNVKHARNMLSSRTLLFCWLVREPVHRLQGLKVTLVPIPCQQTRFSPYLCLFMWAAVHPPNAPASRPAKRMPTTAPASWPLLNWTLPDA